VGKLKTFILELLWFFPSSVTVKTASSLALQGSEICDKYCKLLLEFHGQKTQKWLRSNIKGALWRWC
jgi:hypothetical protein